MSFAIKSNNWFISKDIKKSMKPILVANPTYRASSMLKNRRTGNAGFIPMFINKHTDDNYDYLILDDAV